MASTRFKADKGTMDALVHLRKKRDAGVRGEATVGESVSRRLSGVCFMLTMPGSSRDHPSN